MDEKTQPQKTTTSSNKWYNVDRKFIAVKAYLFFFFAALGCLTPFLSIYARQLGFSATEIGVVFGVLPFLEFFGKLGLGAIADKFNRHKTFLTFGVLGWGAVTQLILLLPSTSIEQSSATIYAALRCYNESYITDCLSMNQTSCSPLGTFMAIEPTDHNTSAWTAECNIIYPDKHYVLIFSNLERLPSQSPFELVAATNKIVTIEKHKPLEFNFHTLISRNENNKANWGELDCAEYEMVQLMYQNISYSDLICDNMTFLDCTLSSKFVNLSNCEQSTNSFKALFWLFSLILLISDISYTSIFNISGAVLYRMLGDKSHKWGNHRLFGTLGYALMALASTFIMDALGVTEEGIDYTISFYVFGALCVVTFLAGVAIDVPKDIKCTQFLADAMTILTNGQMNAFWFTIFCLGFMTGAVYTFLFLFLQDLGSTQVIMGLSVLMSSLVSEAPMMWTSGRIIKKFGHINCLYGGCLAFSARFLSYSFLKNPWLVLPIDLLHGITYGLCWVAATSYVNVMVPERMSASAQGILEGLHWALGSGTGALVSGPLVDFMGPRWTFRAYSVFCLVLFCFYKFVNTFCFKTDTRRDEDDNPDGVKGEVQTEHSPDSVYMPYEVTHF